MKASRNVFGIGSIIWAGTCRRLYFCCEGILRKGKKSGLLWLHEWPYIQSVLTLPSAGPDHSRPRIHPSIHPSSVSTSHLHPLLFHQCPCLCLFVYFSFHVERTLLPYVHVTPVQRRAGERRCGKVQGRGRTIAIPQKINQEELSTLFEKGF